MDSKVDTCVREVSASYIELPRTLFPGGHATPLQGAQLNWSAREKECYAIYYGVKQFEDLLDNRHFVLKTDHKNLTYINVTLTGKVLRWKLYLQDKDFHLMHVPGKEVHQFVPDALSRL